jgi:hypothetical protein
MDLIVLSAAEPRRLPMTDLTKTSLLNDPNASRARALTAPGQSGHSDLLRRAGDIERHTESLINTSAPETLMRKAIDWLAPDPVRKEKQRGDRDLVVGAMKFRTELQGVVHGSQLDEMRTVAETYAKACALEAAKVVAARGLEAAAHIDQIIELEGQSFDESIDAAVDRAALLRSDRARDSADFRIHQRRTTRAETERVIMEGVQNAIRGDLPPRR